MDQIAENIGYIRAKIDDMGVDIKELKDHGTRLSTLEAKMKGYSIAGGVLFSCIAGWVGFKQLWT